MKSWPDSYLQKHVGVTIDMAYRCQSNLGKPNVPRKTNFIFIKFHSIFTYFFHSENIKSRSNSIYGIIFNFFINYWAGLIEY